MATFLHSDSKSISTHDKFKIKLNKNLISLYLGRTLMRVQYSIFRYLAKTLCSCAILDDHIQLKNFDQVLRLQSFDSRAEGIST